MKHIYYIFFGLIITLVSCKQADQQHSHTDSQSELSEYAPYLMPSRYPDQIILNLSEDPLHSVAVNWRTNLEVAAGEVQVAIATHGPEFRKDVSAIAASTQTFSNQYKEEPAISAHYHSAHIDDLLAGEQYVYRVGKDTLWSEWLQIKMPAEDKLSFIYFGDAQNEVKSMWSRVIRKAYATMPEVDFMLHAGDLINRSNRDVEWCDWFYAGGAIHAMIPSVMTPGNHEYTDVVLSPQWQPQFNLPKNGPIGLEETCYEINYPNFKLISLDAEQIDESDKFREDQMIWLDSILTNNPRQWTAITIHYPLFSTKPDRDNPELRAALKPIIDKHRVDIVLQGHDHAYGRGRVSNQSSGTNIQDGESGTMYVVSVSGPKMYTVSEKSWMKRKAGNTQLFQIISIEGNTLHYDAYTATGDLYDAFDLVKQTNSSANKLVDRIPTMTERLAL